MLALYASAMHVARLKHFFRQYKVMNLALLYEDIWTSLFLLSVLLACKIIIGVLAEDTIFIWACRVT